MSALARFVTGRKTTWIVIGAWFLAVLVFGPLAGKLADATQDDFASFLPESAESTEVQNLLSERFPGGATAGGLIVYRREGGLTAQDRAKIASDA